MIKKILHNVDTNAYNNLWNHTNSSSRIQKKKEKCDAMNGTWFHLCCAKGKMIDIYISAAHICTWRSSFFFQLSTSPAWALHAQQHIRCTISLAQRVNYFDDAVGKNGVRFFLFFFVRSIVPAIAHKCANQRPVRLL